MVIGEVTDTVDRLVFCGLEVARSSDQLDRGQIPAVRSARDDLVLQVASPMRHRWRNLASGPDEHAVDLVISSK
jgi:hypothetical protein